MLAVLLVVMAVIVVVLTVSVLSLTLYDTQMTVIGAGSAVALMISAVLCSTTGRRPRALVAAAFAAASCVLVLLSVSLLLGASPLQVDPLLPAWMPAICLGIVALAMAAVAASGSSAARR